MHACLLPMLLALALSDPKREAESLMQRHLTDDRAGELLEQAVTANPADAEAYYLLGRWALVKGRFQRAVEAETRAAELSQGIPIAQMQAWTIVAVANDRMNKAAEAEAAFVRAMTINRTLARFDPNAAYEYLQVLERDHRDRQARDLTGEILRKAPDYGPAHLALAKTLAAANRNIEAAKEAELALRKVEANRAVERDAHYLLARIYLRLKQADRAELHKTWLAEHP